MLLETYINSNMNLNFGLEFNKSTHNCGGMIYDFVCLRDG